MLFASASDAKDVEESEKTNFATKLSDARRRVEMFKNIHLFNCLYPKKDKAEKIVQRCLI